MQIEWFEIIAMIINFFLTLFILQKLLYKPVVKAMDERQERIQKAQIEAEAKMEDAKKLISDYDKKIADIKYVITLDSDTDLTLNSAYELIR